MRWVNVIGVTFSLYQIAMASNNGLAVNAAIAGIAFISFNQVAALSQSAQNHFFENVRINAPKMRYSLFLCSKPLQTFQLLYSCPSAKQVPFFVPPDSKQPEGNGKHRNPQFRRDGSAKRKNGFKIFQY